MSKSSYSPAGSLPANHIEPALHENLSCIYIQSTSTSNFQVWDTDSYFWIFLN
jgi:hypothetical protein